MSPVARSNRRGSLPPTSSGTRLAASSKKAKPRALLEPALSPAKPTLVGTGAQLSPKLLAQLEPVLTAGAKTRRSKGPEGTKALLPRWFRTRALKLFTGLDAPTSTALLALSSSLQGTVRRAIFLRAVLARSKTLHAKHEVPKELVSFRNTLAKLSEEVVLARATALDLDSTVNDSLLAVSDLSKRRGTIYDLPVDTHPDNDGLFQRFTASCGPTVVQMMMAEADPIIAFELHRSGIGSDSAHDEAAKFQKKLLETAGGVALGKRLALIRARLNNALGRLQREKLLSPKEVQTLRRKLRAEGELPSDQAVLAKLRARFSGFPTDADLAKIKAGISTPHQDEGTSVESFTDAMNEYVGARLDVTYQATKLFGRGQAWRHLEAVERSLRQGIDVPFGISEPSHWMMLSDVKGKKPNRQFLVSDPEGGRTAWVKEKDLTKGSFGAKPFELCTGDERAYIDVFLLPEGPGLA